MILINEAAIPTPPNSRHLLRHRHNHSPPRVIAATPTIGIEGRIVTAPSKLPTKCATSKTKSTPHPMACSAKASNPSGIRTNARKAHGMIQRAVASTAIKFANNP